MQSVAIGPVWKVDLLQQIASWANLAANPFERLFHNQKKDSRLVVLDQGPSTCFKDLGLPALEQIPISEQLAKGHPLAEFIKNTNPLSSKDFAKLLASPHIDLSISGYHGGAVAAAVPSAQAWADPRRYDQNLWLRDWALDFFAVHRAGHRAQSREMLRSVMDFIGCKEHRDLITSMHFQDTDPAGRFFRNDRSPHSKYAIEDGKLTWCKTPWAHQQLDAFTAFVNTVYRAANIEADSNLEGDIGKLKVDNLLPLDLRSVDPLPNCSEHILPALIKALRGIRLWDASDVGPWEDLFAHQRATANGLATSMVKEVVQFHERCGWNFLNVDYGSANSSEQFRQQVLELGRSCKEVLDRRVPESGYAVECSRRPHDAAMLLLLYPFKAELSEGQQLSILRTVYANMGEVGFSRFLATLDKDLPPGFNGHPSEIKGEPDLFVGQDYHHNLDPKAYGEFASNVPGYKPAQWSLFDALLSGYYYRRFIESGGIETESLLYADRHLKRCLAFIVPEDTELFVEGKKGEANGGKFQIPKGSLPEAMMWDSKLGKFVHNHNNLLMSRAALALAIERGIEATKYFEHIDVRHAA